MRTATKKLFVAKRQNHMPVRKHRSAAVLLFVAQFGFKE
jgi:hypothetical protein